MWLQRECWLRPCRGAGLADWTACGRRYLLRVLQDYAGLEICEWQVKEILGWNILSDLLCDVVGLVVVFVCYCVSVNASRLCGERSFFFILFCVPQLDL